jgi:succinyl-CoA synthetase beta subunit
MRLHEYQSKRILRRFGVPVPRGEVATSVDEVYRIADRLDKRVVLKAQVLTGGRGQAGGIRLANEAHEARRLSGQMFGMRIGGYEASRVLVDEAIEVEQEIYVAIAIDRSIAQPTIVASTRGGVEIAEVARDAPERVYRVPIDPLLGLRAYQARTLADQIGLDRERIGPFVSLALGLYRTFVECDATLVEANPLVARPDGTFCCLNSKVVIDDNTLFRHRDLLDLWDEYQDTEPERLARWHGIIYVRLGGHVGCLSNGAGLAMATIDLLRLHGVRPANFVDVGKGAGREKVIQGLRLAANNSVEAVVVNVFCSITSCDEVAQAVVAAAKELDRNVPIVIRLDGPDHKTGIATLAAVAHAQPSLRFHIATLLGDAVEQVVALVQKEHAR